MAVTSDQVYGDPEWTRAQPGFAARFSMLMKQYGIVPDAATLAKYGLTDFFSPADAAAASSNPYSIAAQLKNSLSGNLTNNATSANSHGALFSGAFKNMQDASGRDYTQKLSNAGDEELGGMLGILNDREGVYNSIFGRLMGADVAPAATTPAPTPGFVYDPAQAAATGDVVERTAGAHPNGVGLKPPPKPYIPVFHNGHI